MKIEIPPKLTITHANNAFLYRFRQLVKIGRLRRVDLNRSKWELKNPKDIAFLLQEISPYIHTQREKHIAKLLIQQCEASNPKTEAKLKKLIIMHNVNFYIDVY